MCVPNLDQEKSEAQSLPIKDEGTTTPNTELLWHHAQSMKTLCTMHPLRERHRHTIFSTNELAKVPYYTTSIRMYHRSGAAHREGGLTEEDTV